MIDNKIITITKENQFDKGWTLFHPYDLGISENRSYREVMLSDVVRQITHSDVVNLILCESCLSSRIVSEIKWANKYIKLNVIAKDESILNRYADLDFSSKTIDECIDFNYIGIEGKDSGYYIISDGYVKIDDSVNKVYFQKQKGKKDYSFLRSVESIIIIDKGGKKDYSELIKETKKAGVKCYFAVNVAFYERRIFDLAQKESLELLISNFTTNGVILVNRDRTLSCLIDGMGDFFIVYQIQKVSTLLGKEYRCGFYSDTVDTKTLTGDVYSCYNGNLTKLSIADKKVVSIDIPIQEMSDFVAERFNASIVEKHNDYSAEAVKTEYRFALIPPIIDASYCESKMYDNLHDLGKKWKALQTLDVDKIKMDYHSFIEEDFGLIDFLETTVSFTKKLLSAVKSCSYGGYYTWIKATTNLYRYYDEELINVCKNIFNAINKESSGTKFSKFDAEIAGYEQTIKEKTTLIEQGIDVLSNKRRVEILTQKIAGLLELKKRFENTSDTRNDKTLNTFINHCAELLSNHQRNGINDSIGTIVKPKEETKMARVESFVDAYLYSIKKYIENCIVILEKLQAEHVPENYPVYDKGNEKFIVINELGEYEKTLSLCDEFGLKCVTRR